MSGADGAIGDLDRLLAQLGYATVAISEARQRLSRNMGTYAETLAARDQLAPPETSDLVHEIRRDIGRIRAQSAAITKLAVALSEGFESLPIPF